MPYLEIKLGPDTMLLRFVGRIDYAFGRLPRADVQLRDMKVSRLHTQFFIDSQGAAFVRDLGSSGGTFVGSQRLRRGVIAPLTDNMKLRVGDARITFYDAEPPVNAVEPPARSDPRGLIRTNPRERFFEAEATVLAVDKVDPETQSGPAEPPPEINPADFADHPADISGKPKAKTKRNTGIVEAPWEKKESGKVQPVQEQRVVVPKPRSGSQPPPRMQTAEIDELGNFQQAPAPSQQPEADQSAPPPVAQPPAQKPPAQPRPTSPLPPRVLHSEPAPPAADEADGLDETGRTSREPAVAESGAFRPPPPIAGEMRQDDDEPAPRAGMPTVRLERPKMEDRQKAIEQEEADDLAALKIPTAAVKPPDAPLEEDAEPAPQIGTQPRTDTPVASDEEEELTDDQITEYLGGSVSGRFGNVDFGGDSDAAEQDSEETNEVSFSASAKVEIDDDVDIDVDEPEPEPEPKPEPEPEAEPEPEFKESNTSMLGGTTAVTAEPVGETSEAGEKPPVDSPADAADDIPTYGESETPPPPTREGATAGRTFKPTKTRKLMKRRKDTAKITDKKHPTPLPEGAKTEHIPLPASLRDGDQPIAPGAKTMFIPKPDDTKISRAEERIAQPEHPTGKPKAVQENREAKSLQDMGDGPGGDTVALPPAMMKQLQEELKQGKKVEPATIGDNPTVKTTGDEDEEEEDFIIDDDYSFFTPPPPTRAAREAAKAQQSDVIDASDFHAETDNLPADKKAAPNSDPDTLAD